MPDSSPRTAAPRRGVPTWLVRVLVLVVVAAVLLAACGADPERQGGHQPPRDGVAGLQLSGTFGGRQLALSDGAPALLLGDACQRAGIAAGVCFRSRDIDGTDVIVAVLNPPALRAGETTRVGDAGCRAADECAEVADVAVVDVLVGGQRQRATTGRLDVREAVPGQRYAGTVTLGFRDGRLGGFFDVVPLPADP